MDITSYITDEKEEKFGLQTIVDGMHCISCARAIENKLNSFPSVTYARVNMSTNRLSIIWAGDKSQGNELFESVNKLGFKASPYTPDAAEQNIESETKSLLKAIAVSGFAMGNVMLLSVAVWANTNGQMGASTEQLMHWISAMIAVPTVAYSGRVFFKSAFLTLKSGHTNMDVPISLALLLAVGMSLFETATNALTDVYFDSAIMLTFFLLIGRYLNSRARGRAKSAAHDLLALMAGTATIVKGGTVKTIPIKDIKEGMLLKVVPGEKITADGTVEEGTSQLDTSLLTGETLPQDVKIGDTVFAGTLNLNTAINVRVMKAGNTSLLSNIVSLMEHAEQGDAKFVRISDRIAKLYTPVVHSVALAAFLFWYIIMDASAHDAIVHAIAVLIITCPCALGLAIPVVQVIASSRLFRKGILLKSGDALEKLYKITDVVFDKTGTLTLGKLQLNNASDLSDDDFKLAASIASHSKHPFSKAVLSAYEGDLITGISVEETAGSGLSAHHKGKEIKLGKRSWATTGATKLPEDEEIEIWLSIEGKEPQRLIFKDVLRSDSVEIVKKLTKYGLDSHILSGDRENVVEKMAKKLGIESYQSQVLPDQKYEEIEKLKQSGRYVLMVGDGLNDAPALAAAHVSMSPSTAMDITQNTADIVFQGERLSPIVESYNTAIVTHNLTKQNLTLAFLYNIVAIPLAFAGYVTPLIAALAMSASSVTVILNAMRLNRLVDKKMN